MKYPKIGDKVQVRHKTNTKSELVLQDFTSSNIVAIYSKTKVKVTSGDVWEIATAAEPYDYMTVR